MPTVPEEFLGSAAFQFVTSRGWDWKQGTSPNIELETCPYCKKTGYGHLYMEVHGAADEQKNRDGLHICHKCGKGGRLADLKQHLGITISGVESRKDWAGGERKIEELPDIDACHQALIEDADAMDYLVNFRGFSREIIEKQKLGLTKRYFRECGEVRALVYPYLVNGNCVFVHYRTLPTIPVSTNKVPKAFSSPTGWDAPLYNGEILMPGLKEVVFVEGEPNTIAALDKGISNICGVPGANFKKADWIATLDDIAPDKIYIAYDKDKVGKKAAQTLATRLGIERCWRIALPDFTVTTDEGETRTGKDLNEWFTAGGGSVEEFEKLKENAVLFDVEGVSGTNDALTEFEEELLGKGIEPKYKTQWPELNKLVGFDEGDIIDIIAPEKVGKTTFALNLVEHMVSTYGDDGLFICLEMTKARMARKWICHKAQIADNIPNSPEEAQELFGQFMKALPMVRELAANREGDLYFCLPKYKTDDDLYQLITECIRRYGVKWVVIDNLQRWADTTSDGGKGRTTHLSEISKRTSQIGKEYGVQVVRILQPHRVAAGQIVSSDNTDGSSQIAKDCDCNISLHRKKIGEMTADQADQCIGSNIAQAQDEKTLCTVGLSRYSSGGRTWLIYDGARSTFNPFTLEAMAAAQVVINKEQSSGFLQSLNEATASKSEVADSGGITI